MLVKKSSCAIGRLAPHAAFQRFLLATLATFRPSWFSVAMQRRAMKPDEIKARAKHGLTANLLRQVVVQATGLATSVVLARCLSPADFGLFGVISLVAQFFTLFATTGLGFALIRQHEEPSDDDLNAVFTVQFTLTTIASIAMVAVTGALPSFGVPIDRQGIHCLWALAFSAWATSFRLVPVIILERRLSFTKIAVIEGAENLAFNFAAVSLAWGRAGIWALAGATLLRSVVGAWLSIIAVSHPLRFSLASTRLSENLRMGFAFQVPPLVFFLKDLALPAFLLTMLGPVQLGYFVWVRDLVMKFSTFGGLFAKVAFPTFAKLSLSGSETSGPLRASSTLLGLFYGPVTSLLVATSPYYIHYIFSDKWMPSLGFLMLFASTLALQVALNPWVALSQTRSPWSWPLKVALVIAAWDLTGGLVLIKQFGLIGAGFSIVVSNLLYTCLYYSELKRLLPLAYRHAQPPWMGKLLLNAILTLLGFWGVSHYLLQPIMATIAVVVVSLLVTVSNLFLFSENRAMLHKIFAYIRSLHSIPGDRIYV